MQILQDLYIPETVRCKTEKGMQSSEQYSCNKSTRAMEQSCLVSTRIGVITSVVNTQNRAEESLQLGPYFAAIFSTGGQLGTPYRDMPTSPPANKVKGGCSN